MRVGNTKFTIKVPYKTKEVWTNMFDGTWRKIEGPVEELVAESVLDVVRKRTFNEAYKTERVKAIFGAAGLTLPDEPMEIEPSVELTEATRPEANDKLDKDKLKDVIQKLINFFTEFEFEPNYRFVNTFAYTCNARKGTDYILRYFELIDSPHLNSIREKMKSPEFGEITRYFESVEPSHKVNERFKLYYGSQGTGKTTEAMKETGGNCMVCHSAMLPSDLMEDFKFNEGKAEFVPSALQRAMSEGKSIVLDEINLLPFESLRFLQSILDGKKEFIYKGKTIEIKEGFKIIGTMNLTVNGSVYSLPEPLVDRCEEIRKYNLTAKNLMGAIL